MNACRDGRASRHVFLGLALLTLIPTSTLYSGTFSVSGGFQWASGKYIYQTSTTSYALNAGARYRAEQYSLSIDVPVLFQNSDLITRSGGALLPHGDGSEGQMIGAGSHHGGGMMSGAVPYESGIGDVLLTGRYRIAEESHALPSIAVTAQVKVPTANTSLNFGTGKWDYGTGFALRKELGTVGLFADAGYLLIADPAGVNYLNPFTFGAGVGVVFMDGKFSTMLYYQAYTRVLENYDAPQQFSGGLLYQSSRSTSISLMGSIGLSNTTPDVGIAMTVEVTI